MKTSSSACPTPTDVFRFATCVPPCIIGSSSNVTIFSLDLVPPAVGSLPLEDVLSTDAAEDGLMTEDGGGGTITMSLTTPARLNSLTLRGTKYSTSGSPESELVPLRRLC